MSGLLRSSALAGPDWDLATSDRLGLFDTPPDRRQIRFSILVAGLLLAAFVLILPVRDLRLGEIQAFVPLVDAVMFVADLIAAFLLFSQAAIFRSRALYVLATGYLVAALLIIPHVLTFPGAFAHDGLLGAGVNTTAWISTFQRWTFPIAVILYVLFRRADSAAPSDPARPAGGIALWLFAALALAGAITLVTTAGKDLLPPFFSDRTERVFVNAVVYQLVSLTLLAAASVLLLRTRNSVLDMWLSVALFGWVIQTVMIMTLHARFTAGHYGLFGILLVSQLVMTLALFAESNRLYARLALATAARNREHEAHLVSMDVVTGAIAHEIGQPITGFLTNATAGLRLLDRDVPERERAIAALRSAIEDGQRTKAVIAGIRAMFSRASMTATQFSLNDLVRETAGFLERELAGGKVALQLALDEDLQPIQGDRAQIQRVLVNLFANAIDSVSATRGGPRRIMVSSAPLDGQDVLLEVSDTGIGIGFAPDENPRMFEPFFTTKATGSGLGLWLSRTIVAEHGGRLWASPGEPRGAVFHLQLPRTGWC